MRALKGESHAPRPKVIKLSIEAGASIKTTLESEKLPTAHGAYEAKKFLRNWGG